MLKCTASFKLLQLLSILLIGTRTISSLKRSSKDRGDLCKEILSCRCYMTQPTKNASVTELNADCIKPGITNIQQLLKHDIESVILNGGTQEGTIAALKLLKKKSINLTRMTIRKTQLKYLNMSLLPENTKWIRLSDNIALDEITSLDCEHDTKRLKLFQVLSIWLDKRKAPDLNCLPESFQYLQIIGASSIEKFKWPKFLRYFKLTSMTDGYPTEALAKVGENLKSFHVTYTSIKNGIMPRIVGSQNLTNIMVQFCNISVIENDIFLHNRQLKKLDLAGNVISRFDAAIPSTLTHLTLRNNKIVKFSFNSIEKSHLVYLGLHGNYLKTCPMGLPTSLEMLVLNHNQIEICSPKALQRLTKLRQLDLAYNRLKIAPSGITSKLEIYRINSNLLSRIHGPENYEFCYKCSYVEIGGNQWFCDINFFKFLLWISKILTTRATRSNIFLYYGRCKNLAGYAFTQEYLEQVINYTRHIDSPSNDACSYEPQQLLNCTKANLTRFPNTPPRGLKSVIISGNSKLTKIPDYLFANQESLRDVSLSMNNLNRIPFGLPTSVEWLNLQGNNISELSPRDILAFNNLTNLESLILHDNHIKTVTGQDFNALTSLAWLGLEGNDLICDCSLHSFILWFTQLNDRYRSDNPLIRFARCNNPPHLKGRDVRKLFYYYEYELNCISPLCAYNKKAMELNCSIHNQTNSDRMQLHALMRPIYGQFPKILSKNRWRKMFMDGLGLKDEDINMTEFISLVHVDLSNNSLTQWSPERLPRSLQNLNLRGNLIYELPEIDKLQKYLPNLKIVDLRDNKIKTVTPQQTTTFMSLDELYIGGNPFECTCSLSTFKLWAKLNATATKPKSDAMKLRCSGPPDLTDQILIDIKEEEMCKIITSVDIRIWVSVGLFIGAIILTMIIAIRVIKRRRYRQRILTGFQRLLQQDACYANVQNEESIPETSNNDSYFFDAFIATEEGEDDGQFVDKLIEELEGKRELHLCISTRDFTPGMDISDNIIQGITSSKRVILIISKTFVTSPWCQYKVQVALAELHKRQSKLLIPILLEDLSMDAGNNLKTLLSLIATTKAPNHRSSKREWQKFWSSIYDSIYS